MKERLPFSFLRLLLVATSIGLGTVSLAQAAAPDDIPPMARKAQGFDAAEKVFMQRADDAGRGDRTAALETIVRGCVVAGRRDHYPAGAMRAYCRCSARYVFDHASAADIDAGPSRLRRVNGAAARACVNLFPHHPG